MKKEWTPHMGERTKFYGISLNTRYKTGTQGHFGRIVGEQVADQVLYIRPDGFEEAFAYHIKQCRKLKPKKELQRVWIAETNLVHIKSGMTGNTTLVWHVNPGRSDAIEFIEVKKRKT